MIVRIDSSAPTAVIKMALDHAAANGFAVDMVCNGQRRIQKSETSVKKAAPQPKAVKAVKPKAESKPKAEAPVVPEELLAKAKGLRIIAESGDVKLPKEVYGALRSKNVEKLTAAIAEASSLLSWGVTKTESEAHLHAELHKEFLKANPLLAK